MNPDHLHRYAIDPFAFALDLVKKNELGRPFELFPAQREIIRLAFAFDADGRLPYDTIVYACPKKSGKTTVNALLTLWWAYTQEPPNEVYIVANDLDRGFVNECVNELRRRPSYRRGAQLVLR